MTFSIVIGTRHRPESLRRCLESLIAQTVRPDEVLIIDDGQLEPAPLLDLLHQAGIAARYFNKSHDAGLTKSRNLGIRESRGDVVMFLDDDVVLEPQYIEAVRRVYEAYPDAGGVGGRLVGPPMPWPQKTLLRFFLLDSSREGVVLPNGVGVLVRNIATVTPVDWFSGCNMSYRRRVFDRFMFDEKFAGNGWGDDRDFSYAVSRAFPLFCAPDAALVHYEEPRGRAREGEFGRVEITYVYRFFAKHMPRRVKNVAALWWGFAGIVTKNVMTARFARVRGNLAGMIDVLRAPRRRRTALGVLPEQGGSIANLARSGQHNRFVEQYLGRYAEAFPAVHYFSYDDERPALPAGCDVVPNRWRLQRWLYALAMPVLHARRFRECGVLRVMQLTGEVPAIVARILYRIPFVATYGYDYGAHAAADGAGMIRVNLFRLRTRIALAFASRVIVTNSRIRREVEARIGGSRVLYVPNAVDTVRFSPAERETRRTPPVVLFVGRLSPQKNLPLLVDAMARLRTPAILRVVGTGPVEGDVVARAAAAGVTLERAGVVEHDGLPEELRASTVFALSSQIEGHPKVLIEAMSCGCACVGTDVEGIRDLITDRETGLLVPSDAERLASALEELIGDSALRARLGANARAHVLAHYDIAATLATEIRGLQDVAGALS